MMPKLAREIATFILIGVLANLLGFCLYSLLTYCGLSPAQAVCILYPIGSVISFYANKTKTFGVSGLEFSFVWRYVLAQCSGLLINLLLLRILVDGLGLNHHLVQLFSIGVVAAFLFVSMRWFVFRRSVH